MSELFGPIIELLKWLVWSLKCFEVIDPWEKGIVLRFGKVKRDVGPGLRWLWPFHLERIITLDCNIQTVDLPVQSVTTEDDIEIAVSAIIKYRIEDARKAIVDVGDEEEVLADSSRGTIREIVGSHSWEGMQAKAIDKKLTIAIRRRAKKYGVHVEEVQLSDLTTATTFRHMGDAGFAGAPDEEEDE